MTSLSSPKTRVILGAIAWIAILHFFVVEFIAALAWPMPYSYANNWISDLGNTSCGPFWDNFMNRSTYICSPLHGVMNASFLTVGLLLIVGALGTYRNWPQNRFFQAGLLLLSLVGVGWIIVGFAPENIDLSRHLLGAQFINHGGNLGLLALAVGLWRTQRRQALVTIGFAVLAILGTAGLISKGFLMGIGGMERLAFYPIFFWAVVHGATALKKSSGVASKSTAELQDDVVFRASHMKTK